MLAPIERELLNHVSAMPEAQLLRMLPRMSNDELECIAEDFAQDGSECSCALDPLPCECGHITYGIARLRVCGDRTIGDLHAVHRVIDPRDAVTDGPLPCKVCEMEPDFAPCVHFRNRKKAPAVLAAIYDILDREPPPPVKRSYALTQEARAVVLAERHDRGEGLWHPGDLIHQDATADDLDRIERTVYTLSGWKRAGCPDEAEAPPPNGDTTRGKLRVRLAA